MKLKIFNSPQQQRLSFLQAKIKLQMHFNINELAWNNFIQDVGEKFANKYFSPIERDMILKDKEFGFWTKFIYEWMKYDNEVVKHLVDDIGNFETYKQYKRQYMLCENVVKSIRYSVQNKIDNHYESFFKQKAARSIEQA